MSSLKIGGVEVEAPYDDGEFYKAMIIQRSGKNFTCLLYISVSFYYTSSYGCYMLCGLLCILYFLYTKIIKVPWMKSP